MAKIDSIGSKAKISNAAGVIGLFTDGWRFWVEDNGIEWSSRPSEYDYRVCVLPHSCCAIIYCEERPPLGGCVVRSLTKFQRGDVVDATLFFSASSLQMQGMVIDRIIIKASSSAPVMGQMALCGGGNVRLFSDATIPAPPVRKKYPTGKELGLWLDLCTVSERNEYQILKHAGLVEDS